MNRVLDLYKIVRNSIEHFDKLLSSFRTIVLGFNGTIVGTVMVFYGRAIAKSNSPYTDKTQVRLLFIGSALFALINILIWYLEKHYHRYLTMSAKMAEDLEENLFEDHKYRLTYQLKKIRRCDFYDETIHKIIRQIICSISKYIRTYDCLYLFPIAASIFLNIYLANSLQQYDIWIIAKTILILSIFLSYILIRRCYWVAENCSLVSSEESNQCQSGTNPIKIMRNKRTLLLIGHSRIIEFAGFALIASIFSPAYNKQYIFLAPLALGIILIVYGRGMLLQKNWARNGVRWSAVFFALIIILSMGIYHNPSELLILIQVLLIMLCLFDFCYLSRRSIKDIFTL